MLPTAAFHGIIRCVAHLYVRKCSRQLTEVLTAQVCDATNTDCSNIARPKKSINNLLAIKKVFWHFFNNKSLLFWRK